MIPSATVVMGEVRYLGEIAGISAALCWATASVVFSRIPVPARALNLAKNTWAALLLGITLLIWQGSDALQWAPDAWVWLFLSAVSGLVVGDACYFRSLQILGPRRALLLGLIAPPTAALVGWFVLDESPAGTWLGMGLTLAGVAWVICERKGQDEAPGLFPGAAARGVFLGLVAAGCQAVGALWSKQALHGHTFPGLAAVGINTADFAPPTMDAAEGSFLRLAMAALVGIATASFSRRLRGWTAELTAPKVWPRTMFAATLGTYGGIWLSLIAFDKTRLAVATTLTGLAPVFVLGVLWIAFRARVSIRALLGVGIALVGVALLTGLFSL